MNKPKFLDGFDMVGSCALIHKCPSFVPSPGSMRTRNPAAFQSCPSMVAVSVMVSSGSIQPADSYRVAPAQAAPGARATGRPEGGGWGGEKKKDGSWPVGVRKTVGAKVIRIPFTPARINPLLPVRVVCARAMPGKRDLSA